MVGGLGSISPLVFVKVVIDSCEKLLKLISLDDIIAGFDVF